MSLWSLTGEGGHFSVKGRGYPMVDGLFVETLAKGSIVPRRVGVPEAPIPYEMESLKERFQDKFHG